MNRELVHKRGTDSEKHRSHGYKFKEMVGGEH